MQLPDWHLHSPPVEHEHALDEAWPHLQEPEAHEHEPPDLHWHAVAVLPQLQRGSARSAACTAIGQLDDTHAHWPLGHTQAVLGVDLQLVYRQPSSSFLAFPTTLATHPHAELELEAAFAGHEGQPHCEQLQTPESLQLRRGVS